MRLDEALDNLATQLKAAGIRSAGVDPARLIPPCAYVALTHIEPYTLDGAMLANVDCVLIAADHGTQPALAVLTDMLENALTVITPDNTIHAASIRLPASGAGSLPALTIPTTIEIGSE